MRDYPVTYDVATKHTRGERGEVARRLRGLDYSDLQESMICAYLDALGIEGYTDWVGIAHRLADLIEPSCDRDALLKLADEMESLCGPWSDCGKHYAPLIREALGVVE